MSGFLRGHLEVGSNLSVLVSLASWFSVLEHPHISVKLFTASP